DSVHDLSAARKPSPELQAKLRELLVPLVPPKRSFLKVLESLFSRRIATGWAVSATAAAMAVTWLIASSLHGSGSRGELVLVGNSVIRLEGQQISSQTGGESKITGTVEDIHSVTLGTSSVNLIRLMTRDGILAAVYSTIEADIRKGEVIEVDGIFTTSTQPEESRSTPERKASLPRLALSDRARSGAAHYHQGEVSSDQPVASLERPLYIGIAVRIRPAR